MPVFFDKRFLAGVAVFCAYLLALIPAFFLVSLVNVKLNLHISFQAVNTILFTIAIVIVGRICSRKK
ncbi:MAG: hypothetical protein ACTHOC_11520 [Luteimonas sp.]